MSDESWLGHIVLSALVALVMAFFLARLVLARYRSAVLRSMNASRGSGIDAREWERGARVTSRPEPPPLRLKPAVPADAEGLPFVFAREQRLRTVRVFSIAGLAHAFVATILILLANPPFEGDPLTPRRVLVLWPLLGWLVVPTTVQISAYRFSLALVGPILIVVLTALTEPWFLLTGLYLVGIPTAIGAILLTRAVRAVATFVFAACFSLVFFLYFALQAALTAGGALGPDSFPAILALMLTLTFALALFAGYFLLRERASSYRAKRTSDQVLLLDAWWFLYSIWISMVLSQTWGVSGVVGLSAFAAYWILSRAQMGVLSRKLWDVRPRRLLLLRVFGLRRRTEDLLTTVGHLWRHLGSIELIAGPDAATVNLEPHEALDYFAGRLDRRFVTGPDDLDLRMADRDLDPDPDGRFRVNEFFCHENTWRATLQRLASEADVVMMDLRAFSASNRGCEYELEQLLLMVPLPSILLLVDETTDERLLESLVGDQWERVGERSVSAGLAAPELAVVRLSGGTRRAAYGVMRVLCDVAGRAA